MPQLYPPTYPTIPPTIKCHYMYVLQGHTPRANIYITVRRRFGLPTYQIPSDQISASLPRISIIYTSKHSSPLHLYTTSTSVTPGPPLCAASEASRALALELLEEGRMLLLRLKLLAPHTPSINWSLAAAGPRCRELPSKPPTFLFLKVQGPVWIKSENGRNDPRQTQTTDHHHHHHRHLDTYVHTHRIS